MNKNKYFSIQAVAGAYHSLKGCTKNKFWGLLGILQAIDADIIPGKSYQFNPVSISSFLEKIFCLNDEKKQYQLSTAWNVKFSVKWLSEVQKQMLVKTPNIFDLLIWIYREHAIPTTFNQNDLLNLFMGDFHLNAEQVEFLFDLKTFRNIEYSESLYNEENLFQTLSLNIPNPSKSYNITAENCFVSAHPGELSRAPFIQTLYAGQTTLECLILTTFDIDNYYPIISTCYQKKKNIFVDSIYRSFITAIHSKPFILLAGISGTGKSRIVRELARSCDKIDDDPWSVQSPVNYCMIPVKPNWHDSTDLIGYASGISGKTEYVVTDFLRFLTLAWFYQNVPFFLCLDEMNLAPVEQYFAEFLSVIESRKLRDGKIVTDPILCLTSWDKTGDKVSIQILEDLFNNIYVNAATEASEALPRIDKLKEQFLNSGISIPQNLIVMGTVNMDETTFTFSRKVLDRAMTIEMNEVDLRGGLQEDLETFEVDASQLIADAVEGKDIYSENKDECDTILLYLETVNEALRGTPFGIAYRTRNEFLLYVIENLKYKGNHSKEFCMARALDEITSMKILSRIEGDDTRLRMPDGGTLLKHLQKVISGALQTVLAGYVPNAETGESLMVCHGKLEEMDGKLLNGYCTFWT